MEGSPRQTPLSIVVFYCSNLHPPRRSEVIPGGWPALTREVIVDSQEKVIHQSATLYSTIVEGKGSHPELPLSPSHRGS